MERWRCDEINERGDSFCSRCGAALDQTIAKQIESAEEATTEDADRSDLELALQLARAIGDDREAVHSFLEDW